MQFVAIDFETANSMRSSVCALGAVVVNHGQIVEKRAWLVRPEPLWFDPFNVMIHGITEDDVRDKPTFDQLWRTELRPYFQMEVPLMAHNASFDMSVLRHVLDQYEIGYPNLYYYCTRVIAKKAWPGLYSYALDVVADHLGVDFLHHDPTEDAEASAKIALMASELHGAGTLPHLSYLLSFRTGELFDGGYTACGEAVYRNGHWDPTSRVKLNTLTPQTSDIDCDHPLFGKRVVFTGALDSMSRLEAAQRVVNCGGECANTMSRWVSYLVLGQQDYSKLKGESKSSKMRKAEELIAQGADLEVVSESDFLEILGSMQRPQGD